MSISASGPGHTFWRQNNFKKLSENMYGRFVRDTNNVLNQDSSVWNSTNHIQNQISDNLSASQVSTQESQAGSNNTTKEADMDPLQSKY